MAACVFAANLEFKIILTNQRNALTKTWCNTVQ